MQAEECASRGELRRRAKVTLSGCEGTIEAPYMARKRWPRPGWSRLWHACAGHVLHCAGDNVPAGSAGAPRPCRTPSPGPKPLYSVPVHRHHRRHQGRAISSTPFLLNEPLQELPRRGPSSPDPALQRVMMSLICLITSVTELPKQDFTAKKGNDPGPSSLLVRWSLAQRYCCPSVPRGRGHAAALSVARTAAMYICPVDPSAAVIVIQAWPHTPLSRRRDDGQVVIGIM